MPREDPLRTEYRLLKALTEGKLPVHIGFTTEQHNATHPDIGITFTSVQTRIKKMHADGTIVGWAPIISERGLARLRALETIYGGEAGDR